MKGAAEHCLPSNLQNTGWRKSSFQMEWDGKDLAVQIKAGEP
jgi:hypothetical protein